MMLMKPMIDRDCPIQFAEFNENKDAFMGEFEM